MTLSAPDSSCSCWRLRPTGRCGASERSSTRPPRAARRSRPPMRSSGQATPRSHRRRARRCARHPLVVERPVAWSIAGRVVPALSADSSAVVPARGVTVVTRTVRLRQEHPAGRHRRLVRRTTGRCALLVQTPPASRWQRQVAWLPQRPTFVAGSIADNLRLGRPDAADDVAVGGAACRSPWRSGSGVLPAASTRPLGQDGATLSAGERARLALGRVLVADRPWNLLDEPTAHVDELTERVMADAIVDLGRRSAVVRGDPPSRPARARRRRRTAVPPRDGRSPLARRRPEPGCEPAVRAACRAHPARRRTHLPRLLRLRHGCSAASPRPRASPSPPPPAGSSCRRRRRPAVLTLLVAVVARPHVRDRPAGAALRRAAACRTMLPCRLLAAAAWRCTTPSCRWSRRDWADGAATCSPRSWTTSTAVVDRELRVRQPVRRPRRRRRARHPHRHAAAAGRRGARGRRRACSSPPRAYATCRARAPPGRTRSRGRRGRPCPTAVVEIVQSAPDLLMWQAGDRAERAGRRHQQTGSAIAARRAATWVGAGRALTLAGTGAVVAIMALMASSAARAGDVCRADGRPARAAPAGAVGRRGAAGRRWCPGRRGPEPPSGGSRRLARTAPAVRDTVSEPGARHAASCTPRASAAGWQRGAPLTAAGHPGPAPAGRPRGRGRAVRMRQEHTRGAAGALPGSRRRRRQHGRARRCTVLSLDDGQGRGSATSTTIPTSSRRPWPRTSGWPGPERRRRGGRGGAACGPARRRGSRACPTACTPGSATGTRRCPGGERARSAVARIPPGGPARARPGRARRAPRPRHRRRHWPGGAHPGRSTRSGRAGSRTPTPGSTWPTT